MGGSVGHQAVGLRKKCEALGVKGRVVLQDLKETVERVGSIDGVEVMEQDFFQPQSIKGILASKSELVI
jgi:ACT domain-containing protein